MMLLVSNVGQLAKWGTTKCSKSARHVMCVFLLCSLPSLVWHAKQRGKLPVNSIKKNMLCPLQQVDTSVVLEEEIQQVQRQYDDAMAHAESEYATAARELLVHLDAVPNYVVADEALLSTFATCINLLINQEPEQAIVQDPMSILCDHSTMYKLATIKTVSYANASRISFILRKTTTVPDILFPVYAFLQALLHKQLAEMEQLPVHIHHSYKSTYLKHWNNTFETSLINTSSSATP